MKVQFLRQVILAKKHKISHKTPNSKNLQRTSSQSIPGVTVILQGTVRVKARIHVFLDHVRVTMKAR